MRARLVSSCSRSCLAADEELALFLHLQEQEQKQEQELQRDAQLARWLSYYYQSDLGCN